MAKKETRYGPQEYVRRKVKNPITGEYVAVYGKTITEREEKISALQAVWAREIETAESPYFFQYAAAWYARICADMTPERRKIIAREINNNLCPVIGQKHLIEITSDDALDVLAARTARSKSARARTLQTLNRILDAAVDAGKLPRNPCRAKSVKPGGERRGKKKALTRAQEQTLLQTVQGLTVRPFVFLCLYTGLRREEAYGLQWQDVHLDDAVPWLQVEHICRWVNNNRPEISDVGKSEAAWRAIPIPPALLPELTGWRAAAEKSAPGALSGRTVLSDAQGGPVTYQGHRKAWGAIVARSARTVTRTRKDPATGETVKVPVEMRLGDTVPRHPGVVVSIDFEVTPHTLRRTYITRLILGGVDLKRVQYLAGHESPDVTLEYYTDLHDHQPEDLIDDVSAIFPG